ncbi:MAG: SGNH/GDSL hydrolase family protein [Xanthobacteraceae bacterium]
MPDTPSTSQIPVKPAPFRHGLKNFAQCLSGIGPARIVAIGSSTTAGEGGIVAYPYRLEALLRDRYGDLMIDVLNRGIGGQEAPQELVRMERDVIAEKPSLVVWQVGTNAVWQGQEQWRGQSPEETVAAIRAGLARLRQVPDMDIVLMDLQYVPALLTADKIGAANQMVASIAAEADAAGVNLFGRFAMMKAWHEVERVSFDTMVDPTDPTRLHDSDWSTQRLAWSLKDAILDGVAAAMSSVPVT